MGELFLKGYAVRLLLEASVVAGDKVDEARYYRLALAVDSDSKGCSYTSAQDGKRVTTNPTLSVKGIETSESISSDQGASLAFNGSAEVAEDILARVRPMDRLRIEITDGGDWMLAFDGFVAVSTQRITSTPDRFSKDVAVQANGLWKFLNQSWFNWQGAVQPGYDVFMGSAGQNLSKQLEKHVSLPGQDLIRLFLETALSLTKIKTHEGLVKPGNFFEFGSGREWVSAFGIAYPLPAKTLPSWKGPLAGMVQMMAQPDIHECFCTYRMHNGKEKPTIIYRPRPFPGGPGDDAGWNALKVHKVNAGPMSKAIQRSRQDGQHPNAFHWSQGASDSGWTEHEQKILHGCIIDNRSIERYGYAARPVASTMPPLSMFQKDDRAKFVDAVQDIMLRIAYQEAPLPELWSRSVQFPLRPGVHAGDVLEDYSEGKPWTGYVATVHHRISANPWAAQTTVTMVRCLQCTAKDYPSEVRKLVKIERKEYTASSNAASAASAWIDAARKTLAPLGPSSTREMVGAMNKSLDAMNSVPYGAEIVEAARRRGIPPWVLAHVCKCESGFGKRRKNPESTAAGVMQFLRGTANGLNASGYDKPFNYDLAQSDDKLALDAGAWYLKYNYDRVASRLPSTATESEKWAWAIYGYGNGTQGAIDYGKDNGWQFPAADRLRTEYVNEWGPEAVAKGKALFGGLQ